MILQSMLCLSLDLQLPLELVIRLYGVWCVYPCFLFVDVCVYLYLNGKDTWINCINLYFFIEAWLKSLISQSKLTQSCYLIEEINIFYKYFYVTIKHFQWLRIKIKIWLISFQHCKAQFTMLLPKLKRHDNEKCTSVFQLFSNTIFVFVQSSQMRHLLTEKPFPPYFCGTTVPPTGKTKANQ